MQEEDFEKLMEAVDEVVDHYYGRKPETKTGLRIFPHEDVLACREVTETKEGRTVSELALDEKRSFGGELRACPGCGSPPEEQEWFLFTSPPETWANMCGREGYMGYCARCDSHVNFLLTVLN